VQQKRGIGVIGLGMASLPHGRSLAELTDKVDVRAVYSPNSDRRRQFSKTFGFPVVSSIADIRLLINLRLAVNTF